MTITLEKRAAALEAADRLARAIEIRETATAVARAQRRLARLEVRLRRDLRRWWKAQGKATVRALAPHKAKFAEASLQEAMPAEEFDRIWAQVARATSTDITTALDRALTDAVQAGGVEAIAQAGVDINFTLRNPRAVRWLRNRAASQVTKIDTETRDRLRVLLTQAGDEGWAWTRTAREIEGMFTGFDHRVPAGRHLRTRGELVAVNELAEAYGEGNDIVRGDLAKAGLDVEKRWSTAGDDRVSAGCEANEDVGWIAHTAVFPSGHGREPRFPGCRCVTTTRVRTD